MCVHPLLLLQLAQSRHDDLVANARPRGSRSNRADEHAAPSMTAHFAHREAGGIAVDLYWTHGDHEDTFRVDVVDHGSRTRFTLYPTTGREAIDVYHHPFFALAGSA